MTSLEYNGLYFDVDVMEEFRRWWHTEGAAEYEAKYGNTAMAFVVLNPASTSYYIVERPLDESLYELLVAPRGTGADEFDALFSGPTGLLNNVAGKLRFVIRTGQNSVQAETQEWLLEPGDFPFEGAGIYRGFTGGVSGLANQDNWKVFCWLIDKFVEIRRAAARAAIERMKNRDKTNDDPLIKYLGDIPQHDDWPEERVLLDSAAHILGQGISPK